MNAEIGQNHGYEPGVGALLRASRLRRGEELQDIAALLRIRYPFLEAIEDGRYQELPGSAYAIGFVRTYAEHLGLDSEEVVRRFKAEAENLERRSDLVFPSPIAERSTPGGAIVFVGILMAAVAYGAWYLGTSKQSFLDDLVSPLPDRLTAMIRGNGQAPGADPSTAPSDATGNAPTAPQAPAPATPAPEPAPTPPAGQAVAPPAEGPAPTTAPSEPPAKAAPAPAPQPQATTKPVTAPPSTPVPPAVAPAPAAPTAAPAEPPRTPPVARVEPPVSAPAAAPVRPVPPAPVETPPPAASAPSEAPASPPAPPPMAPPAPPAAPATAPVQPPAPPATTAEGPAPGPTTAPTEVAADASSRIVVRAKLDSWIQVRDGVGRRLLVTRLLRAGETYRVPNQPSLSLLTGNAGGLEILVDGEPVPAIGDVGTVRRDVTLEADRLKAGTAVVD